MSSVSSVMTANPATCSEDTAVRDVARMMADCDCGEIPVVDAKGKLVGVVTDRDITLRIVAQGRDTTATARDAMSAPVRSVHEDSGVEECARLMKDAQVRRIPVIDEAGRPVGIVALADIIQQTHPETATEVVREVSRPAG